ncbi:MAG: hypothetical protein SGJ02_05550 [bacterium]|nr:hypothetical protein [bacterium]
MHRKILIPVVAITLSVLAITAFVSCGGTSGGEKDLSGAQFVADESVGTIEFSTTPDLVEVSRTAPFAIKVRDGSGTPVQEIQVSCDTEQGLALIEPTTGREITDKNGGISGSIGCERLGSYQLGCRLPVGANKRVFTTVRCTGEIPDTFTGFVGAGGGGLGGGQQISDNGGPGGTNTDGFGILSTTVSDGDSDNTFVIDTNKVDTCGDDGNDSEPFGDATAEITFINETNSSVFITSYTMTIPGVGTFGPISVGGSVAGGISSSGGRASLGLLIAVAQGDGSKTYAGSSTSISSSTGFKNVTFTFDATNDQGDDIGFTKTLGLTFSNANRCTSGGGGSGGSGGTATAVGLSFADSGTASSSIDVTDSNVCTPATETESIGDASFTMTVNNGTGDSIAVTSYSVSISGVGSTDSQTVTGSIADGDAKTFTGTMALGTGTAKTTLGGTTITAVGNRTVTIVVTGTDSDGSAVTLTAANLANFTEVDNCG